MELLLQVYDNGPTIGLEVSPSSTFLGFILSINSALPEFTTFPYVTAYIDKQGSLHALLTAAQFEVFINSLENVAKLKLIHGKLCKGTFEIADDALELHNNWFDVLIIGSGLGGLCAAYTLIKANKYLRVAIIEKEDSLGGNSIKASSGISLIDTPTQQALNIKDSIDLFIRDTIISGKGESNPQLVYALARGSERAWRLITEECRVDLSKVTQCGGHSVARTHRPKGDKPAGYVFVTALLKKLSKFSNDVRFFKRCEAKAIMERRTISGLVLETRGMLIRCRSSSVIIATGGFANDHTEDSLLKEYAPELKDFPTTNGPFAQGKGLKIAAKIGATLIHMSEIQLHPTGFIDPKSRECKSKILAPELLRGVGGVLVNEHGKRFCNELGTRDYITGEILKNCRKRVAILVLGGKAPELYGPTFEFYVKKGFIKLFPSLKELCKEYGISLENMTKELKEYEECEKRGRDKYGKTVFPNVIDPLNENCYYACEVTPSLHYTMGGLKVDHNGAVYRKTGMIRGLYAVGESTGGVHGKNRLVGNSLMECIVFGQRTARALSHYLILTPKL